MTKIEQRKRPQFLSYDETPLINDIIHISSGMAVAIALTFTYFPFHW